MKAFKGGDRVCCGYRLPAAHQWWLHPVYVGTVAEPSDVPDADGWVESRYCRACGVVPVDYAFGRRYESADSLFAAPRDADWPLRGEAEAESLLEMAQERKGGATC